MPWETLEEEEEARWAYIIVVRGKGVRIVH